MNQKALKNAQRVLKYERQQFDLMLADIAKTRSDLASLDHRVRGLQRHLASNLRRGDLQSDNKLHCRENLISYEAVIQVKVGRLKTEMDQLVAELARANQKLTRKRARVKSIETLVERAQSALTKEREIRAGIELSDLVLGSLTKESS